MTDNGEQKLSAKKVAFLVTNGVEQPELTEPRKALQDAGAETVIVSPAKDSLTAMKSDWHHADVFEVDVPLEEADPAEYDALVLPGGTLNADALRITEGAVEFLQAFLDADRPVAAICHAPWLLVQADAVRGRKVTSYASVRRDLENAGAQWEDSEVVVDGHLITSRTPDDLEAFSAALIQQLQG